MDSDRFDQIVRSLTVAPSRRGLAQIVSAGLLTAAGWGTATDTSAKGKAKKKKKKKCKPQCGECQTCSKGKCQSKKDGTPCAGAGICEDGRCESFCTPKCQGKACGANDGCGGICKTGSCPSGATCVSGLCECTPVCQGQECGASDGCGGFCPSGSCPEGAVCESGNCNCVEFACCSNADCNANQVCVTIGEDKICVCDVAHSCGLDCCPLGTTCTSTNPVICSPD